MTTPIDMRAEQPEAKETVKMDKDEITRQLLDKVLLKLTEVGESQAKTTESVVVIGAKVDALGSKVDTMSGDVHTIKAEQVEIREWKGAVEERFKTHSIRASTESVHDEHQDVKLQELENRITAATESSMRALIVETKAAVAVVAKTPLGQKLLTAGGYMLLALFGCGTLYFGALAAKLQQPPPPPATVQMLAPVTIYADAGAR